MEMIYWYIGIIALFVIILFLPILIKKFSRDINTTTFVVTIGFFLPNILLSGIMILGLFVELVIRKKKLNKTLLLLILCFSTYILVSNFYLNNSLVPSIGTMELITCLMFIILVTLQINSYEKFLTCIKYFYFFSYVIVLIGIFEFINSYFLYSEIIRISSIFTNPITFSVYAAVNLIIGIYILKYSLFPINRKFTKILLVLLLVVIFLAMSRATWIGLSVVFLILFIKEKTLGKLRYLLVFSIGILIVFLALPSDIFYAAQTRLFTAFDTSDPSTSYRLSLFIATFHMIKDNFLIGSGFGSFLGLVSYYAPDLFSTRITHPHNSYLELLQTSGLVGTILFFTIIFYVVRNSIRIKRCGKQLNPISDISSTILFFFLSFAFFDRILTSFDTSIIFWLVLGFLCIPYHSLKQ